MFPTRWRNLPLGRTQVSGSGYPGSSPGLPANLFNYLARAVLGHSRQWEQLGNNWK